MKQSWPSGESLCSSLVPSCPTPPRLQGQRKGTGRGWRRGPNPGRQEAELLTGEVGRAGGLRPAGGLQPAGGEGRDASEERQTHLLLESVSEVTVTHTQADQTYRRKRGSAVTFRCVWSACVQIHVLAVELLAFRFPSPLRGFGLSSPRRGWPIPPQN